jgi:hypothetical protein
MHYASFDNGPSGSHLHTLRTSIAAGTYRVDARRVASSILLAIGHQVQPPFTPRGDRSRPGQGPPPSDLAA